MHSLAMQIRLKVDPLFINYVITYITFTVIRLQTDFHLFFLHLHKGAIRNKAIVEHVYEFFPVWSLPIYYMWTVYMYSSANDSLLYICKFIYMEKKSKDFYLTTCLNVGCMSIRPVSFVVALHKAVDLLFKVLETEVGKDSFNIEIF